MRASWGLFAVLAVGLTLGVSASSEDVGFEVIVNASNPVESLSRSMLSDIFLKQKDAWPDGQAIVPVDQAESAPVRESFSRVVLRRPVQAVKSFWQKQIFSGSAVPPVEKASSADVVAYVSAFHGAVGYVNLSAKLPSGVKVVRLSD